MAGKKALKELNEEEMDAVTAAGDTVVIIAENGEAKYEDKSVFSLAMPEGAQEGLRALTVQNVVGEVQLLVNLNVLSASGDVNNTDQRNFAVQSWGSTAALFAEKVEGQPGAPGGDGGDLTFEPTTNVTSCGGCEPCCDSCCGHGGGTVSVKNENSGDGGSGGNASAAVSGLVEIGTASGDVIVKSGATGDDAIVENKGVFSLALEEGAQTNMSSLFIANIVGRAQTAFNINIASSRLNLFPSADGTQPFAEPLTNATGTIKQVNSGVQFRGTPLGVGNTHANVQVNHTPN
jgi:hypothetical protein